MPYGSSANRVETFECCGTVTGCGIATATVVPSNHIESISDSARVVEKTIGWFLEEATFVSRRGQKAKEREIETERMDLWFVALLSNVK